MAIPDYQTVMLPLLKIAADGNENPIRKAREELASTFALSEDELKRLLPSGNSTVFESRVGWARTYLKKAGLIDYPKRGYFRITARGKKALLSNPQRIDGAFLRQFPEFVEFNSPSKTPELIASQELVADATDTPEELLFAGYLNLRKQLEFELLSRVKACPPEFFERLIVKLIIAIGYGGSLADAGRAIGRSGDGGIDGVIKEDKLGLDLLFLQAKRWENATVGRPEIQKFVGALYGRKAKRGIFITTSTYSKDAQDYVEHLDVRVILIDGPRLAELMFDHDVGVTEAAKYVVKRVDSDFFEDETSATGPPAE